MKAFLNDLISLDNEDVHIWKFDKSDLAEDLSDYKELLNDQEKKRASKFRFDDDRDRFLWGRVKLKLLLGSYLNESPRALKFFYSQHGKPELEKKEHQHLHFNMSHSGDLILFGISRSPIGVDVEEISRGVDIKRISDSYFSPNEKNVVEMAPDGEKENVFYEIWTKKEALIKGIGNGLGIPLNNFCVMSDKSGCVKWMPENLFSSSEWYVGSVETMPSYKAAFATLIKNVDVAYYPINKQIHQNRS